ncbi:MULTISPECIES: aldo/keto reductase [Pseudonocardia]|uniref:L-glyceraldehyde 3-phosphate reductase n=2 Tax=Pseudonocardia TaxID=1847 RepID=A0A1Y2MKR7_PSEAH|nr:MULTISPECIES: aldo/keto reductase [Pseudonocardia]OSY35752.1 L-glyceraldehyde 3-phosphate reductase [Pseudonocardia autotrophica]TDN74556.1 NDP-hexose 2,3-enoyl reductase [Pseudonocardia autotrophica]BBG05324.1 oxidoreductase [Pseudonocardia autotrophica]GEC27448.1 oxidoreductase [Pseudonocardia saturnea]
MEYTHLGRSGLTVSRLVLGTDNFGTQTTPEDAAAIMDRALDLGINVIDTGDVYGWRFGEGYTEQIIGTWLAGGAGRRDRTVLATKLYGQMAEWPNNSGLSALHIRRACEASLRRLGVDHIDLYQMHHIDRTTPWEEIWEAMDLLKTQGKIVYVGSSNHPGWHIAAGQEAAARRGRPGLVSEQTIYNLLERTAELEVLPACAHYGVGMMPWSPLDAGLLGGILRKEREQTMGGPLPGARIATHRGKRLAKLDRHRDAVQAYEDLCDELGAKPADVAVAWLLARPGVSATIIGPRTVDQLVEATGAFDVHLGDEVLARLDAIFPGPGPAPEAYSW